MRKMSIKDSTMITPSVETPRHILWLSSLDYVAVPPFRHSGLIFIYRPNHNNHHTSSFFDSNILKASLSQVLVPFYPLAGRLKRNENGRLEIECNGKGVLFTEVVARESLDEFGKLTPELEPRKWLIPSCDYSKGISSFPLLMVQLTRFTCGAIALGTAQHHQLGDGTAYLHFTNSWATIAKGHEVKVLPVHDRLPYLSARHPPRISFLNFDSEYGPPQGLLGDKLESKIMNEKSPTTVSTFNLTKNQVNALKEKATLTLPEEVKQSYKLTTYEVLAAHIWRCACKARGLVNDQEVRLFIPTDGRSRLKNPSPPQGIFANVTFYPACIAKAGEITSNTLGYAASKVHETMLRINDEEYLRSTIDYLESHPDKMSLVRGQYKLMCPNININSWTKLRFDELDFGWGKPFHAGSPGIGYEGQTFITGNINGDGGISISIKLFTVHMTSFNKYFSDEKCLLEQTTRHSAL